MLSACAESMIPSALPWMLVAPLKRLKGLRRGLHRPPSPLFPLQLLVFFAAVTVTATTVAVAVIVATATIAAVTVTIAVTIAVAVVTAVAVAATNIKSIAAATVASTATILATFFAAAFS
jgi:hypothetical protein